MAISDEARALVQQAYDNANREVSLDLEDETSIIYRFAKYHIHNPRKGRLDQYRTFMGAATGIEKAIREGRPRMVFEVSKWR